MGRKERMYIDHDLGFDDTRLGRADFNTLILWNTTQLSSSLQLALHPSQYPHNPKGKERKNRSPEALLPYHQICPQLFNKRLQLTVSHNNQYIFSTGCGDSRGNLFVIHSPTQLLENKYIKGNNVPFLPLVMWHLKSPLQQPYQDVRYLFLFILYITCLTNALTSINLRLLYHQHHRSSYKVVDPHPNQCLQTFARAQQKKKLLTCRTTNSQFVTKLLVIPAFTRMILWWKQKMKTINLPSLLASRKVDHDRHNCSPPPQSSALPFRDVPGTAEQSPSDKPNNEPEWCHKFCKPYYLIHPTYAIFFRN